MDINGIKINHKLVKGILRPLKKNIYGISIRDDYDRAMLFCRYQEYYESPYKQFKGKYFSLFDYMRFYKDLSKTNTFSYHNDWEGFNLPSTKINEALDLFLYDNNMTEYDKIMHEIYTHCECDSFNRSNHSRQKFYLIGIKDFRGETFKHELAHGLYYTNVDYKTNCDLLIKRIKKRHFNLVKRKLIKMGYHNDENIIKDEIQAYFSTGLANEFDGDEIRDYMKPFIDNFRIFLKK